MKLFLIYKAIHFRFAHNFGMGVRWKEEKKWLLPIKPFGITPATTLQVLIEFMTIIKAKVRERGRKSLFWGMRISNLLQDQNLDREVSSKRPEAKDEANTLAFPAPRWKFRWLCNLILAQTLLTSIMWKICPKIWLVSPKISKFRWGRKDTQRFLEWKRNFGHAYSITRKERNNTEKNK